MTYDFDVLSLADELAEIARTATDETTGQRLMEIVHRLMTEAGLPDDVDEGGGEPPAPWISAPVYDPT